jgi:hypothetical protein
VCKRIKACDDAAHPYTKAAGGYEGQEDKMLSHASLRYEGQEDKHKMLSHASLRSWAVAKEGSRASLPDTVSFPPSKSRPRFLKRHNSVAPRQLSATSEAYLHAVLADAVSCEPQVVQLSATSEAYLHAVLAGQDAANPLPALPLGHAPMLHHREAHPHSPQALEQQQQQPQPPREAQGREGREGREGRLEARGRRDTGEEHGGSKTGCDTRGATTASHAVTAGNARLLSRTAAKAGTGAAHDMVRAPCKIS